MDKESIYQTSNQCPHGTSDGAAEIILFGLHGKCYACPRMNTSDYPEDFILMVKQGGGSIMFFFFFLQQGKKKLVRHTVIGRLIKLNAWQ